MGYRWKLTLQSLKIWKDVPWGNGKNHILLCTRIRLKDCPPGLQDKTLRFFSLNGILLKGSRLDSSLYYIFPVRFLIKMSTMTSYCWGVRCMCVRHHCGPNTMKELLPLSQKYCTVSFKNTQLWRFISQNRMTGRDTNFASL